MPANSGKGYKTGLSKDAKRAKELLCAMQMHPGGKEAGRGAG